MAKRNSIVKILLFPITAPVWAVLDVVAWALQLPRPSTRHSRRRRPIYRS